MNYIKWFFGYKEEDIQVNNKNIDLSKIPIIKEKFYLKIIPEVDYLLFVGNNHLVDLLNIDESICDKNEDVPVLIQLDEQTCNILENIKYKIIKNKKKYEKTKIKIYSNYSNKYNNRILFDKKFKQPIKS